MSINFRNCQFSAQAMIGIAPLPHFNATTFAESAVCHSFIDQLKAASSNRSREVKR